MYDKQLIRAALTSNEEFIRVLREKLKQNRVSISEFNRISGIPLTSLNKLMKEKRDIRMSTLRQIVRALWDLEKPGGEEHFIAVIASKSTLDQIKTKVIEMKGSTISLHEYPAVTIDDALKSAIKAEMDGALAIVCAPLLSGVFKDLINIPITSMYIEEKNIMNAVKLAATKAVIKTG